VLHELNDSLNAAPYLLGHNLLAHDLEMCRLVDTSLPFLQKPAIDTIVYRNGSMIFVLINLYAARFIKEFTEHQNFLLRLKDG
jgi:hypothetical protein